MLPFTSKNLTRHGNKVIHTIRQIFKRSLTRWLIISFGILALVAVSMAVLSVLSVQFTDNTLSQVTARVDTAALSTQIRSESLVLTDMVRRYTAQPATEPGLRSQIVAQQKKLDALLQQVIASTNPNDVDESIAISQVRQFLIAFGSQANRTLTTFNTEGQLGPATQQQLLILTENYQAPLHRAIRDFEELEAGRVYAARLQSRRVLKNTVTLFATVAIIAVVLALVTARNVVKRIAAPLTVLHTGVEAIRRGDLSAPVPINSDDEIGRLAGALNNMSAELRQYREQMEELVQKRTAELAATNQKLSQEITEREQAKQALRLSEENFRRIFDANPFPLLISRQDNGQILMANQAMAVYLETPLEQLTGSFSPALYGNPTERQAILHDIETDGKVVNRLLEIKTSSNRRKVTLLNLLPIKLGDVPVLLVGSADITDRVEAEETTEAARSAAEAANRAKSAFLAHMSHELRTPLNGILGYTQILRWSKNLDKNQLSGLTIIEQSGKHLLTLINDILDFSKIEAGKLQLNPTKINLHAMLDSIVSIIQMRAQQKDILFKYEFDPNFPPGVEADETRLREVLTNLLSNAVKFTDRGQVTLRIKRAGSVTKGASVPDGYQFPVACLLFEVEDTGMGIPEEQIQTIFQPFEQAGDASFRAGGTGLGLAISRQLVQLMGGNIFVDSKPGKGSRFWFTLELPETEGPLPNSSIPSYRQISGIEGNPPQILIVDDNPFNRMVLRDLLLPPGVRLLEAENGREGLEKAQQFHPDSVIVDLMMPVMNGFDLTQQLRNSPQHQKMVIIATSASVYDEDRQKSLAMGANAFLPKPIEADRLFALLEQHLKITWKYETPDRAAEQDAVEKLNKIALPPVETLEMLHQVALIGDLAELKDQLGILKKQNPTMKPFSQKLLHLANGFQINKICKLLAYYLET